MSLSLFTKNIEQINGFNGTMFCPQRSHKAKFPHTFRALALPCGVACPCSSYQQAHQPSSNFHIFFYLTILKQKKSLKTPPMWEGVTFPWLNPFVFGGRGCQLLVPDTTWPLLPPRRLSLFFCRRSALKEKLQSWHEVFHDCYYPNAPCRENLWKITYTYQKFKPHVRKCSSPMEHLGYGFHKWLQFLSVRKSQCWIGTLQAVEETPTSLTPKHVARKIMENQLLSQQWKWHHGKDSWDWNKQRCLKKNKYPSNQLNEICLFHLLVNLEIAKIMVDFSNIVRSRFTQGELCTF